MILAAVCSVALWNPQKQIIDDFATYEAGSEDCTDMYDCVNACCPDGMTI